MDTKQSRFNRNGLRSAAMTAAAVLALTCGGAAIGQPTMGPGGPMGHGPHGPGGFGDHVGFLFEAAKPRLALNTSQQLLWDGAVAQTKAAREAGRALRQKVHDAVRAEIAKAEPDLAAIAAVTDDAHAQGQALRHQVRDQWLKLYSTFNAQQKAVVRELMQQRMERAERFRERMRERWGGGS